MIVSGEEQEVLDFIEKEIGEPLPEVPLIDSYTFGYKTHEGHVIGLGLFSCATSGILERIVKLSFLKKLFLRRNAIEAIPEELCNINSLEIVDLSENKIEELPESLCAMSFMKELYLESNRLNIFIGTIEAFPTLEILDLSENKLIYLSKWILRKLIMILIKSIKI